MKLDTDQFMDIVLNTSDDFEISIDFSLPTYPIIQLVVCRKKGFIELTQLIGIKVKIHLNSFDDTADFITWLDSLCSSCLLYTSLNLCVHSLYISCFGNEGCR